MGHLYHGYVSHNQRVQYFFREHPIPSQVGATHLLSHLKAGSNVGRPSALGADAASCGNWFITGIWKMVISWWYNHCELHHWSWMMSDIDLALHSFWLRPPHGSHQIFSHATFHVAKVLTASLAVACALSCVAEIVLSINSGTRSSVRSRCLAFESLQTVFQVSPT